MSGLWRRLRPLTGHASEFLVLVALDAMVACVSRTGLGGLIGDLRQRGAVGLSIARPVRKGFWFS